MSKKPKGVASDLKWSVDFRTADNKRKFVASDIDYKTACLVSAAPELLEACKWFMDALETGLLVRDITKDSEPSWAIKMLSFVKELQDAQAAIAKAEGK